MSCGRRPRVGGGVGAAYGRGQEEIPCWPCAMIVPSGSHICGVHPSLFSFLFFIYFLGDRRSSSWHSAVLYNDNPGHSPARHASLASEKLFLCHTLLVTPCTGPAPPAWCSMEWLHYRPAYVLVGSRSRTCKYRTHNTTRAMPHRGGLPAPLRCSCSHLCANNGARLA